MLHWWPFPSGWVLQVQEWWIWEHQSPCAGDLPEPSRGTGKIPMGEDLAQPSHMAQLLLRGFSENSNVRARKPLQLAGSPFLQPAVGIGSKGWDREELTDATFHSICQNEGVCPKSGRKLKCR